MNSSTKIDECLEEDERIIIDDEIFTIVINDVTINGVFLPIGKYSLNRIIGRNRYSEFVEYILLYVGKRRFIASLIRNYDDLWQLFITLPNDITPSISDVPKFWHLKRAMRETEKILSLIIHGEFSKSKPYQDLIRQQKIEFERVDTDIPYLGPHIIIEESVFGNSMFKKYHKKTLTGEGLYYFDLRGNELIGHAVRFYGSDGWELCFVYGFGGCISYTGLIVNTVEEAARLLEYFLWELYHDDTPFFNTQRYLEYKKRQEQSYRGYNGRETSCCHTFRLSTIGRLDLFESLPAEPWVGPDNDYVVEVIFRKFKKRKPLYCLPPDADKRIIDIVVVTPYISEGNYRKWTITCWNICSDYYDDHIAEVKNDTIPVPEEEYPFIKSQLEKVYSKIWWSGRNITVKTKIIRWEDIDWEKLFAQFNITPDQLETYKFEKFIQEMSNE